MLLGMDSAIINRRKLTRSASQRERITLIKVALMNKIGEGGVKHYGLDSKESGHTPPSQSARSPSSAARIEPPATTRSQPATQTQPAVPEESTQSLGDEPDCSGMYL